VRKHRFHHLALGAAILLMENLVIDVYGGNIEGALRALKKKSERGLYKEMKAHDYYVKPSAARRLKSKKAQQRLRKEEKKRAMAEESDRKPHHQNGDYIPKRRI
jgi:small subunit ribosomal protein S21